MPIKSFMSTGFLEGFLCPESTLKVFRVIEGYIGFLCSEVFDFQRIVRRFSTSREHFEGLWN